MAHILLLDPDEEHARALAAELKRYGHSVAIYADMQVILNDMKRDTVEVDVVIVDLTSDRPEVWEALDQIWRLTWKRAETLMVLCISRVYRGPRMKLEVERRGARMVYER